MAEQYPFFPNSGRLLCLCVIVTIGNICFANGRQEIEFTVEPQDQVVVLGQPANFHCQLLDLDDSSEPIQVFIRWLGDDPSTFFDHRDPHRTILSNGTLHIPHSTFEDQGSYQCVASIDPWGSVASRVAKLQVVGQISFLEMGSQDLRVFPGETAHFSCLPHGPLKYIVSWLKNERPLSLDKSRMVILPSGSLEIDHVGLSDQGSYRCNASYPGLYKLSNKAILTVNTDKSPYNVAPIFITRPMSVTAKEGDNVTLDCAANGNPRPWLVWLKDGVAINMSDTRFMKIGTGGLHIVNIQEKDVGNYQCRAGNQEDTTDASALVQVQVPPRFIRKPQDTVSSVKKDLELPCQIYGKPEPKVQWLKNGELITVNDYLQYSNGYNLKILGLMEMDAGIFQCVAFNTAGNSQTAAKLSVLRVDLEKPSSGAHNDINSTNGLFLLTSDVSNSTENVEYFWKGPRKMGKGNKPLREYFSAMNAGGESGEESSTIFYLTPSPPRDLRAAIVSNRFVTLSWTRPLEVNGNITAYSVYYRLEGSQRERVVNTTDSALEEITVQGLQPDRLYHFRVVAHNSLGPGESSKDLEVSTGAEAHVPSAPIDLTVVSASPTSINIEWKPPALITGDVLKYKLFYMEEDSPEESHIYTAKTSHELTGLRKFTDYAVWVIALNSNGPGSPTEEITVRTLSDVPSEPPMNITLEPASSTSIIVRWEPPPKEGQNGVITGYKIRYKKPKGRGFVETAAGDRRLYALSNLEKGTTYMVRLSAMNVNGTGPPTEWHSIDTYDNDLDESMVPDMPSNIIARPSSNSIRVSWGAPKDSNIMVRGYTIGWGKGIPDEYTEALEGKQRYYNIEGLEVDAEYVIAVRAYNERGDGQPSYVSVRTRDEPAAEAQAPLIPPVGLKAIVLSSSTVVLYWTDALISKTTNSVEDRYYTVKYSPHHLSNAKPKFLNVTELNCMITELKPNTLYEFSVKLIKGRRESKWSMVVHNTTQEAPPSSSPRDLTVVPIDGQPDQINLNWQPPKQGNGLITGYMILYTTDDSLRESDWVSKDISGDKMTAVIRGLQPRTTYYFKIQAKNSKGYGPVSNKIDFTTPDAPPTYDANLFGKDGRTLSNMMIIILSCSLVAIICVLIIISVVCCKRAKSRRRNDTYLKSNMKMKNSVKPPDLWIHHDQMELKNLEKSHNSNSDIGPSSSGSQMNTLVRASSSHPSEFDHTGSLDKRNYLPSYVGSNCTNQEKTSTIKRNIKSKPISLPLEPQLSQPAVSAMTSPGCDLSRPVYPRTQYRAHLTMDTNGGVENPYSLQGGYDSIASMPHAATLPAAYPSIPGGGMCSGVSSQPCAASGPSACQVDGIASGGGGTLTKRQLNHPLKSFSVPAPPPQSAPGTPQQKHVVRPQQGSSPYKKPMHSALCTGSPSNSKLRTGPGTAEETTRLQPSNSTEELNQEMANLEGLMKDLNAITASEFEC